MGEKEAAKKEKPMRLLQMGFIKGSGQSCGALGANEQGFRQHGSDGVTFRHDESRKGRKARRATIPKYSGRQGQEQLAAVRDKSN